MSDDKLEATGYRPKMIPCCGQELPQRTPMEALAAHGEPPDDPPVDRMHYASPGRAPWAPSQRHGLPAWAWVSIVLGTVLLVCGSAALIALVDESGPAPVVRTHTLADVTVTGTCEKKLVGEYGLVATVTATNNSDEIQTGAVWVRWPVTGEAAQEFTKRVVIEPGKAVEFPVNQEVPAAQWYRTGACSYGWTVA